MNTTPPPPPFLPFDTGTNGMILSFSSPPELEEKIEQTQNKDRNNKKGGED